MKGNHEKWKLGPWLPWFNPWEPWWIKQGGGVVFYSCSYMANHVPTITPIPFSLIMPLPIIKPKKKKN
ncbi:hypothetical protein Hanom_Chr11g00981901 [Helianthus anomalus]